MALTQLASDIATVLPDVDSKTKGQYGEGIGSENEERQLDLLFDALKEYDSEYDAVKREVSYPSTAERCDIQLPDRTPVEAKLIRYWRANGDPEHHMPKQVFSPFHENRYHGEHGRIVDILEDEAGTLTGDERDSTIYRVQFSTGEELDLRHQSIRPPIQ